MTTLHRIGIAIIVAALALGVAYWRGWIAGDRSARGELEPKIAALEDERAEAERQARALRDAGRIRAEQLAAQVSTANAQLVELKGRLTDEIRARASASRRCLSRDAVRVLNAGPAGGDGQAGPAARSADAPPAAAAADPDRSAGGASELAVAQALIAARTGYESCRTQLHALIDWARAVTE